MSSSNGAEDPATDAASPAGKPGWRKWPGLAVALGVATAGLAWIYKPATSQTTDNAYVSADTTTVAPKVRGLVAQVLAQDNQVVHAGDQLVRIDAEEFDARVATAQADLAEARSGVASAKAALLSLHSEEQVAAANVRAASSGIASVQAQAERAQADRKRYANLVSTGAVAVRDADAHRAEAVTADQDVAKALAMLDMARQSEAATRARRAVLEAGLQKAEATVARMTAALELARQDLRHSVVTAPIDGVVGNRQVQQGDYVQPGTHLLTLVPLHERHVTANFKETQTGLMRPGQRAHIEVDALPGQEFHGTVESLAPGSGATFSLLPFEPGTGNFTKIVQRVPVRIRFDPQQADLSALRPGLSVTVKVALKE